MAMRVFGIDPGLQCTGWGVITLTDNHLTWLGDGVVTTEASTPLPQRLLAINHGLMHHLAEYQVDMVGVEEVFLAKGIGAAMKLGMARGVALVAVAQVGVALHEVAARQVKRDLTGSGRAEKAQVASMVGRLLNVTPMSSDSADALAIAISTAHRFGHGFGHGFGQAKKVLEA
ncbi:MAG: crossover junction endodeoxyribonuclease RuvC [Proteobacteria bacterium]|nr:crossover junction endodeoxyribonuclease RuvC [Pseudomonadota bacterium]